MIRSICCSCLHNHHKKKKKKIVFEIYPTFLEGVMTILLQTGTKFPFALFGQINQHFFLLPKLNREMPLF